MVTEAEDMFSEMLYEKAIQFDTAIPDMREGSFRNKLKQWVNSDNSEYREYKKANKEGIMLYKITWNHIDVIYQLVTKS